MRNRAMALTLLALLPVPPVALGEELPRAERHEALAWYSVLRIKFKPAKTEEALRIAYDHFVPADQAIGRKIVSFDFQTGAWDHVVFFPLATGTQELEWATSPREAKWWAAFARLEGGIDQARQVFQRFETLVDEYHWDIARRRR